ncbi:MAG: hypothetical protein WDZ59_08525 [Pirellulales bacterium]
MIRQVSFRQVAPWVAATVLLLVLGSAAAQEIVVTLQSKQQKNQQMALPAEIERLAREYRIQVYNSFRADRPEYDRRRQAWEDVHAKWRDAGAKDEHVALLADWLRDATRSSLGASVSALPLTPAFGSPPVVAVQPKQNRTLPVPAAPPVVHTPPSSEPQAVEPAAPQRAPVEVAPLPQVDRVAEKLPEPEAVPGPIADARPERPAPAAPIAPPRIKPLPLPPPGSAQLNIDELAVRIAGYNLAMRSLDAELLGRTNHSIADLAGIVHRLDELRTAHEDVKLYWNLLDSDQRQGLSEMFPARELITSLADRIGRTRGKLVVDGGAAEAVAEQRALLDDLSRKLAELAVEFEQAASVGY